MKTILLTVIIAIAGVGIADAGRLRNDQIKVGVNQEKTFYRSKIRVKFIKIVDDSRCPTDVQCVWQGNAKVKLRLSRNGVSKTIELNSALPNRDADFGGYRFKIMSLTPEPRSNIRINRNGYRLVLEAVKVK